MKSVSFEIKEQQHGDKSGKQVRLTPPATTLVNSDLLLIAARCVQLVGDREGLDKALEMLNTTLYSSQRISDV